MLPILFVILLAARSSDALLASNGTSLLLLVPAIFNFGDSTTDTGTNTYLPNPAFLANFTPYGESYFNPPTGRFTNGRLPVDFLASEVGLPFLQPYLKPNVNYYEKGISFASAGSGYLDTTKPGGVVNINQQLAQFRSVKERLVSTGNLTTALLLARSLFYIASGTNDYLYSYFPNVVDQNNSTLEQFTTTLIDQVRFTINTLYAEGGRKFIVNGLAPFGCVPYLRSTTSDGSCYESANDAAKSFNARLPALQSELALQLPGALVVFSQSYNLFNSFINNGSSYGFTQGSTACCGAGAFNGAIQCGTYDSSGNALTTLCSNSTLSQYVFFDNFHPTEKAYKLLLDLFVTGGTDDIFPINIEQLIRTIITDILGTNYRFPH